jgi:hypothetical protein
MAFLKLVFIVSIPVVRKNTLPELEPEPEPAFYINRSLWSKNTGCASKRISPRVQLRAFSSQEKNGNNQ